MTYDALLNKLPPTLTIPTLGGRKSITILNHGTGELKVLNSKGRTYTLTRQDWRGARTIHKTHPRNPWNTAHYTELSMWYSYSLIYAAALLCHIIGGEHNATQVSERIRLQILDAT